MCSHLFVYDIANTRVDPSEKIVHAFRDLSGEIELAVELHRFVHVAEGDVEHVVAPLVAEECLVHLECVSRVFMRAKQREAQRRDQVRFVREQFNRKRTSHYKRIRIFHSPRNSKHTRHSIPIDEIN